MCRLSFLVEVDAIIESMTSPVLIIKASGEREEFNDEKLFSSLKRAGASNKLAEKIIAHIKEELQDGMTTANIYKHAFFLLHKFERRAAARYSLRRALADFGPTGFPFEKFIAELFKDWGYEVKTDQLVQGSCVAHEIDIVAWNEAKLIMVESKFHNDAMLKSDLKVALYVKARFDDLLEQTFDYGRPRRALDEGWLITNTKFSQNAISYGKCVNLKMIGWNYPEKGNLQDLVEDSGLHPITCLTTLDLNEKKMLLGNGLVLCRDAKEPSLLQKNGIPPEQVKAVVAEAEAVCVSGVPA